MNLETTPTPHLFRPFSGNLRPFNEGKTVPSTLEKSEKVAREISSLIQQKDYPCVAALKSFHQNDYQVGLYGRLGTGESWKALRNDLLFFLAEQKKTSSIYLSFWAVFEEETLSEDDFEKALWRELSYLTSEEDRATDWPASVSSNPEDHNFQFSLAGSEFFVVGLHSQNSRKARRFSSPTMIFNVFSQFDQLEELGQYDAMVETNRKRDRRFQGTANPMSEAFAEEWESIQFSGKANSSQWKCPFHFFRKASKP